ncbi:MAG: fdnG, partial [Blastococcus sp.]|nr:fdnG [Blastococcus sp.]
MPGLGTSFGRGGATNTQQDLANSDCIVIEGSNMAECHPVGFQWVTEAKARGAKVIHIDPRFTRTSAIADLHVPLRAGSDIVFLGALVNHVLQNELYFKEYVVAYTNAANLVSEQFQDTEDLDGLFSGFDPEARQYDQESWQYEPDDGSAGDAPGRAKEHERQSQTQPVREAGRAEAAGSGGPPLQGKGRRDETLQHPRSVFQILKRHFARYTPEVVSEACGIEPEVFGKVAEWVTANSGRERTTAWVYSVGWTQHTVGAQYIRTASILQALLGNIGRPGGGIMALRGHASIQGSTDIPTLFNLLPGYLPMPHAHKDQSLDDYTAEAAGTGGFWGNQRSYMVSLLKAWWGDAAQPENDFCFDYLPRING